MLGISVDCFRCNRICQPTDCLVSHLIPVPLVGQLELQLMNVELLGFALQSVHVSVDCSLVVAIPSSDVLEEVCILRFLRADAFFQELSQRLCVFDFQISIFPVFGVELTVRSPAACGFEAVDHNITGEGAVEWSYFCYQSFCLQMLSPSYSCVMSDSVFLITDVDYGQSNRSRYGVVWCAQMSHRDLIFLGPVFRNSVSSELLVRG